MSTPNDSAVLVGDRPWPSASLADHSIRQLSVWQVFAIWLAATAPMAVGSWIIAPRLALRFGELGIAKALVVVLAVGMVWQFVLTAILVAREQHSLRWLVVRDALWLRAPRSPKSGRRGGKLWLIVIPLILGLGGEELIPVMGHPANRDLVKVLASAAGHVWLEGSWGWFAVLLIMWIFNTVVGEELLFRGFLLPRMTQRFGSRAWLANGVAFAAYHLHAPWAIPGALFDSLWLSYPSQRYRSAWVGIIVHSAQTLFFSVAVLAIVLK